MVFVLKLWRDYLYGVHYEIFSDYRYLQYTFSQRYLNLRERRWIKLLKDYNLTILYHLGKANVVVDALIRKASSMESLVAIWIEKRPLAWDIQRLANGLVRLKHSNRGRVLDFIKAHSSLIDQIHERQFIDEKLCIIREKVARVKLVKKHLILMVLWEWESHLCAQDRGFD